MVPIASLLALLVWQPAPPAACAPAGGCTCIESPAPPVARRTSHAVFLGKVTDIREGVRDPDGSGIALPTRRVTLRVERVWKGDVGESVVVTTGWGGGDCGYPFEIDGHYLVYAGRAEGELTTSICSRTRPAAGARAEMAALGPSLRRRP